MNEREKFKQIEFPWSSIGHGDLSAVDQGKANNARELSGVEGATKGDYLSVTIIIKQAGVYGSQQQCEIKVNPDSNLLKALSVERKRGKDATKLLLNGLEKAVRQTVLSLVS